MKKGVLENFAKFTGKHLWFAKFSKTPFLQNASGRLLLILVFQKQPPEVFKPHRSRLYHVNPSIKNYVVLHKLAIFSTVLLLHCIYC